MHCGSAVCIVDRVAGGEIDHKGLSVPRIQDYPAAGPYLNAPGTLAMALSCTPPRQAITDGRRVGPGNRYPELDV